MEEKKQNIINIKEIIDIILQNKKKFAKTLVIAFVAACAWILPQPRFYTTTVILAPETEEPISGGSLSSLASSFGINMGGLANNDAIYPVLYPDLLGSPNFIVNLFDVEVETEKGELKCDYFTYLSQHQKVSFWLYPKIYLTNWFNQLTDDGSNSTPAVSGADGKYDVFCLSKRQLEIIEAIKSSIKCTVDKKTDVITITVTDQDRKISALMADSVRVILQKHITDYRTSKARADVEHYEMLAQQAHQEYEEARHRYAEYADANIEVNLQSYKTKVDDLENEMQTKYNTYSALNSRLQAAHAKVQERTPAFTVLNAASMARKPAGPKRMIFIAGMMFLSFVCLTAFLYIKKNKEQKK